MTEANEAERPPTDPDGDDWVARQRELEAWQAGLIADARAVSRAMEGWGRVGSQEEWLATVAGAPADYRSGRFLLERLGGERFLDPELMATLLTLRQGMIAELGLTSMAELMLADLAILSYFNALRVQGWVGNLSLAFECEWFGSQGPVAKFHQRHGRMTGLRVEEVAEQMVQQLLPLLERANRMLIQNVKAIKELRQPTPASVSIGQMNVAAAQSNTAVVPATPCTQESSPDGQNGARVLK